MRRINALPTIFLTTLVAVLTISLTAGSARAQASGLLVRWGSTSIGQGSEAPPASERFAAIDAGNNHSLALRADGSLVQWGRTSDGQLNNAPPAAGPYIAIAAGASHNLALRPDGSVVQWGSNAAGQTDNAPPTAGPYIAIAVGTYHCLALRADGSLVQWGRTSEGQAANAPPAAGPYIAIAAGSRHNLALRADGSLVQWGTTGEGQDANAPAPTERFIAITAGSSHNVALRVDGSLVQWGDTSALQADNTPPASERFIAIAAGFQHTIALRVDGSLVQWGDPSFGQNADAPPAAGPYMAIAAGGNQNLAIKSVLPTNVSFTYQGRLTGQSGPVDLQCDLYDAAGGGNQVGATTNVSSVAVDPDGLVTALITPGAIDASGPLWLEVRVAPEGSGSFTTLTPRQPITRAPQASFADVAATAQFAVNAQTVWWSGIKGVPTNVSAAFSPWNRNSRGIDYRDSNSLGNLGIGVASPLARVHVGTGSLISSEWQALFTNTANSTFRGGMRLADSGFFEVTNNAANAAPNFARLASTGAWSAVSDARLKTDVTNANGNLAAALNLRPVNFRWKSDGTADFGLIAQEVRQVLPRLVTGDESKESLTVNYSQLSVVAIGAIQELKADNDRKQRQIDELKARLERLEKALGTTAASK